MLLHAYFESIAQTASFVLKGEIHISTALALKSKLARLILSTAEKPDNTFAFTYRSFLLHLTDDPSVMDMFWTRTEHLLRNIYLSFSGLIPPGKPL